MIRSLSRPEAFSAVNLLCSWFAGFLGDVKLNDKKAQEDADFLTSEDVSLKTNLVEPCYRASSP